MAHTAPLGAAAPTPAAHDGDTPTIHLAALHRQQADCGYTRPLHLSAYCAADLATHLRGIEGVAAVLTAGSDHEQLDLGPWISAGLVDAVAALARSAAQLLSAANDRAQAAEQGGAQ